MKRLFAIALLLLFGCAKNPKEFSNPKELIICLSITEDYDKTAGKVQALQKYLSTSLNMPVKIHKVTNGTAVIEAVKAEKTHVGSVGSFSYIVAKSKVDIEPLVSTAAVSDSIIHNYRSNLIVPANSKLNTIEDLKANAKDLSIAWSYPTSTSGHLVPRGYLKSIGVLPANFKEVIVSENHVASVYSCITNKVDVAAVSDITLKEYTRRGKITPKDYKIIWESEPIRRGAIFISKKVNQELKNRIKKALTDLHITNKEMAKAIHYQHEYDIKYVSVTDKDYDELRNLAKEIKLIE